MPLLKSNNHSERKGIERDVHQQGLTRGVSIAGEDLADTVDVMIELIRLQFKTVSRSPSSFSFVVEFLWREKKTITIEKEDGL